MVFKFCLPGKARTDEWPDTGLHRGQRRFIGSTGVKTYIQKQVRRYRCSLVLKHEHSVMIQWHQPKEEEIQREPHTVTRSPTAQTPRNKSPSRSRTKRNLQVSETLIWPCSCSRDRSRSSTMSLLLLVPRRRPDWPTGGAVVQQCRNRCWRGRGGREDVWFSIHGDFERSSRRKLQGTEGSDNENRYLTKGNLRPLIYLFKCLFYQIEQMSPRHEAWLPWRALVTLWVCGGCYCVCVWVEFWAQRKIPPLDSPGPMEPRRWNPDDVHRSQRGGF